MPSKTSVIAIFANATIALAHNAKDNSFDSLLGCFAYLSFSNSTPNLIKDWERILHLCREEQNSTVAALVRERDQTILFEDPDVMLDRLVIHSKSLS